ncbi:hypothetical protein SAMN04490243_1494 [Robiginitalea myxolifaciens]|uniref:Long-chain fatty acid transport protein n=1 Tax=Robiginitalea myxolifaciens TaxID=400055 RepID=A0A1I6GAL6_9FLAO|nr:hypothetical protein [Robiginitalea myxolifaciens]SFR39215.1 hypothetical protein SAMN04490243_1494 [Robiginitalea myxolifaciens]
MLQRLFFASLFFVIFTAGAQDGTVSPYSSLGVGDLRQVRTVENQSMGGLGIYTDSIHLHLNNPAALGKLGATVYTAGISHQELRLETFDDAQNSSVSNLNYLAIAFPIKLQRAGVAFGIKPYSSVGYNLEQFSSNAEGGEIVRSFTGTGGINQAFLSLGFAITPELHIGATGNFNFGRVTYRRIQIEEGVVFGTLDERISEINGFDFNYALTYQPQITDKHTLFLSARAATQRNLVSTNEQRIETFVPSNGNTIESINVNLDEEFLRFTEIKVPTTYSLGAGIGEDKHWFVGAEYSLQQFSDFQNVFLQGDNVTFEDASSIAIGGYFIPNFQSLDSYFSRIVYRAGFRLDNTGYIVNDKPLEDFGITFGLGVPLGGDISSLFSNLNLGFELGRRGTTMNSLVRESYFKVNLGLSFNSRWFQKRRIN